MSRWLPVSSGLNKKCSSFILNPTCWVCLLNSHWNPLKSQRRQCTTMISMCWQCIWRNWPKRSIFRTWTCCLTYCKIKRVKTRTRSRRKCLLRWWTRRVKKWYKLSKTNWPKTSTVMDFAATITTSSKTYKNRQLNYSPSTPKT